MSNEAAMKSYPDVITKIKITVLPFKKVLLRKTVPKIRLYLILWKENSQILNQNDLGRKGH